MKKCKRILAVFALTLTACGGGGEGDSGGSDDGVTGGGAVVDVQPAGQGIASVDGQEYTLEVSTSSVDCTISNESITFAFWVGDNSVGLGGGANLYDDGWLGNIELRVTEPEGEPGPVTYYANLAENGDGVAIDGNSMSYSGPMLKQPPNDGSQPEPVDVGTGSVSVTCP